MTPHLSGAAYLGHVAQLLEQLASDSADGVAAAAELITASLVAGGVVQVFGTGHSQATAMEIAGRAGGLIPTNRIALGDLVTFGGEPPAILADPLLERSPGLAGRLLDLVELSDRDVFVIVSNSGINSSIVDMALEVARRGFPLIAITSLAHAGEAASRHSSGKKLRDIADVVIDNLAPYGDTVLPMADGRRVCAVSSVTSALLVQMVVAEVVRRLEECGVEPPVYVSANIAGGHERNLAIEARYGSRLRRWAV
jgi:uncharacterized phosphosugar-binding protein